MRRLKVDERPAGARGRVVDHDITRVCSHHSMLIVKALGIGGGDIILVKEYHPSPFTDVRLR